MILLLETWISSVRRTPLGVYSAFNLLVKLDLDS